MSACVASSRLRPARSTTEVDDALAGADGDARVAIVSLLAGVDAREARDAPRRARAGASPDALENAS